jgi:hypothetical protein
MNVRVDGGVPQGLKPAPSRGFDDTAKALPFPRRSLPRNIYGMAANPPPSAKGAAGWGTLRDYLNA